MPIKLLFLTNHYFFQPTVNALSRLNLGCGTKVVAYDNFDHITQVYDQYADAYDAVFVTGTSAKHRIDMKYPKNQKQVVAYQVDSDALHRDILRMAIELQNLDFQRIAVDFLVPLDCGYSVVDFLKLDSMAPIIGRNKKLTESAAGRDGSSLEQTILDRIISLWDQKSIDMVLCLYASIVPALQERGIPFRCPFISDGHLKRLVNDALIRIELNHLHENHPAIIQVFPRHSTAEYPEQMQRLHDCLQQYIHENLIDCVLQKTQSCCTLITSMQILRFLTNEFQNCQISSHLEDSLDFSVAVGYGVGTTISHAMNNVQVASKEAKIVGKSFLVDSNGTLIGPLNSEKRMVISPLSLPDVGKIAKQCNLSAMTIQKLISIMRSTGSDKITTQELARQMDTTVRNANRIMLNLCKGGAAKPVYTQTSHSRGRPIQIYALDFDVHIP